MLTVLKTPEEKGYNKCISCEALGISCDGPNLTAVSPDRFCEWCRLRKEYLGWTNAHVIEVSGVSKATVERIMAGTVTGLNGDTKSRIACALIYGVSSEGKAWGRHPCAMAPKQGEGNSEANHASLIQIRSEYEARIAAMEQEHEHKLQMVSEAERPKIDHLKSEVEFYKAQLVNKDRMLDDRAEYLRKKDTAILTVSLVALVLFIVLVIALIVDFVNPDVGYFWREALASVFERTFVLQSL